MKVVYKNKNNFKKGIKMPATKSRFENLLVKMAAVEALQDPFFHMYNSASDEENFKRLDVSKN